MQPVANTVRGVFLFQHASARATVPTTFTLSVMKIAGSYRTTSSLWNSHQSTLGLSVYSSLIYIGDDLSSSIHHIIRLQLVQFGTHILRVLQSRFSLVHGEASLAQLLDHHSANPAILAKHQKRFLGQSQ